MSNKYVYIDHSLIIFSAILGRPVLFQSLSSFLSKAQILAPYQNQLVLARIFPFILSITGFHHACLQRPRRSRSLRDSSLIPTPDKATFATEP